MSVSRGSGTTARSSARHHSSLEGRSLCRILRASMTSSNTRFLSCQSCRFARVPIVAPKLI